MRLRGVLAGALVLIALEAVTRNDDSADRVGGMLSGIAGGVRRLLDPTVPAIPDLTGAGAGPAGYTPASTTVDDPDVDDEPAPRLPNVASV